MTTDEAANTASVRINGDAIEAAGRITAPIGYDGFGAAIWAWQVDE